MVKYRNLLALILLAIISSPVWGQKSIVEKSRYTDVYNQLISEEYKNWWLPVRALNNPFLIKITTQEQFNNVVHYINEALQQGYKDIKILFGEGPFFFNDEHILLRGELYPDVSIHFVGNNTIVIPAGHHYKKGDIYNGAFSVKNIYMDDKKRDLNIWGKMYHTDQMVEVLDVNTKLCRVHCPYFSLPNDAVSNETYLQLTKWYLMGTYKVLKVEGNYVYFIADDLAPGLTDYGNYNVNYDYTVENIYPRFRVCNLDDKAAGLNIHIGEPVEQNFYECKSHTFLKLYGVHCNSLDISNFKFYGNTGVGSLLDMRGSSTTRGIHVYNCEFHNIKSAAIYMMQTSGVVVTNNYFEDCYSNVVLAIDKVKNTIITDNYFKNVGKDLLSSFAIRCQSSNFYVARNTIVDFGLGGIGVGKGISEKYEPGSGIVEDNVLYYTEKHHDWSKLNSLIDGGAIYLWTRNEGTAIRFNRIHNYVGAGSNRGIYCDDGAYGFSIYGNIISSIDNYNYIDSRFNPIKGLPTNTNNIVLYNIVEGAYQFVGSSEPNNGCIKGQNIILTRKSDSRPELVIDNFANPEEDVFLGYNKNIDLVIKVPRSTIRQLKKLPFYRRIKKYFRV